MKYLEVVQKLCRNTCMKIENVEAINKRDKREALTSSKRVDQFTLSIKKFSIHNQPSSCVLIFIEEIKKSRKKNFMALYLHHSYIFHACIRRRNLTECSLSFRQKKSLKAEVKQYFCSHHR